jgi:hypothetical protein
MKELGRLEVELTTTSPDPCRLVRQMKELGRLEVELTTTSPDPCRLVRQVKEFERLARIELLYLPREAAGVADRESRS